MTRTKRRYNNPRKRIFWVILEQYRHYERDRETGMQVEIAPTREDYNWLKRGVLCMGNCPRCKDTKQDQMKRTMNEKMLHFEKFMELP